MIRAKRIESMTSKTPRAGEPVRVSTGVTGLDDILCGGLPANRLFLVKGAPGVGKTTLALQFLLDGANRKESVLYITLSETAEEILQVAASHDLSLDGVSLFELSGAEQTARLEDENTLYAPEDVDLRETMRVLLDEVDRVKPRRVVFDSLSEVRILARSSLRFRRQLLGLKQHFVGRACTVLLLDDGTGIDEEAQVESLVHGVISLEQLSLAYGADRRRMRVTKLRGSAFRSGFHDYTIFRGGLAVYPRLIAAEHRTESRATSIASGVVNLDVLLGGGIDRSTCTLIMGPAGCGKSALATQFAAAAVANGEAASLFLFEERIGTWLTRGTNLGMPLREQLDGGALHVHQIDPAELAPDEFTNLVRHAVDVDGARIVVIDSMTAYFTAMPEARFLSLQMHELLSFLNERGIASVITMAQSGVAGTAMTSAVDVSYLADTVLLLRYFEDEGRLRKAISVVKKRSSAHEDTIREFRLTGEGIGVGEPLTHMRGILSGVPTRVDGAT